MTTASKLLACLGMERAPASSPEAIQANLQPACGHGDRAISAAWVGLGESCEP